MKLRYILFKDAQHLKTANQPDEAIAETHLMADGEQDPPAPWKVATPTQLAEYQHSISDVMMKWQMTQPFLVEGEGGARQERFLIDGKLQPKPTLEPSNS